MDSSQKGSKKDREGAWNSHCDTKDQVIAGRGAGDRAMRLIAGQHRGQGLAVDETHRSHLQVTELGLQGMGDGGGDSTSWKGSSLPGGRRRDGGVEGVNNFGPNVVSFTSTSGWKSWYVAMHTCLPTTYRKYTG